MLQIPKSLLQFKLAICEMGIDENAQTLKILTHKFDIEFKIQTNVKLLHSPTFSCRSYLTCSVETCYVTSFSYAPKQTFQQLSYNI